MTPTGAPLSVNVDPAGNPVTITNQLTNFGWEYVWHCHILGHEENDMMHALVIAVPPEVPSGLTATVTGNGANTRVRLNWTDNSLTATGFTIQRAGNSGFTSGLVTFSAAKVSGAAQTFTDPNRYTNSLFYYRVLASNTVGSTVPGYPTLTADSLYSNTATVGTAGTAPAAPSNLTATILSATQIRLNWTDNANNETSFTIQRNGVQIATVGANTNTYTNTNAVLGQTYTYGVAAVNASGTSAFATVTITIAAPAAPSNVVATAVRGGVLTDTITLTWADNSNNETSFTVQRATNSAFTAGLNTSTTAANVTTLQQTTGRVNNFYYRVRANNAAGSSAWVNATPFPVVTP